MLRGEIGDRRRDHAEVDDIHTGRANAFAERSAQLRSGKTAVATDRDRVASAVACDAAERLSNHANDIRRQRFTDNAADVVSLEDFGSDVHRTKEAGDDV